MCVVSVSSLLILFARHISVVLLCLSLSACIDLSQPRTIQQKGLDRKALDTISAPVNDPDFDYADISFEESAYEDEIDPEEKIDKKFYKRISISVTESMKMREALTQMANLAGINIFIAQDIEGSISFTAKDRPFLDILKDVCSSSGLKYTISGNSVKIETDFPTLKFYRIPSLNVQRDTQSSVSISTDIFNGSLNSSGTDANSALNSSQANNGSNSVVAESSKNDFWVELENALKMIIGETDGNYVSVHRQGGLITAYTTQNKHEEIKKYINMLKEASEEQVLIEAKILEVNLNDEFKTGINWNIMRGGGAMINKTFDTSGLFSAGIDRTSLSTVVGFIEKFGAVKTLSSPRITILNNHSAILKVAQNEIVYFPEFQREYSGKNSENTMDLLSTNVKTIPIGLIMKVQPSIDRRSNSVLLSLRPTISKIASYKKVPFMFNNSTSSSGSGSSSTTQTLEVPTVDVRELDSVLRVNSGQIVVMGGLMQEQSHNNREGLPGFMDTPVDYISGERDRKTDVTELVIFLRATILRKKGRKYHKADEKIYKMFSSDPRQLKFKKK
ncbi:MAG: secretin N-terminal domain-containing protein [Alphaproteobacteria bacterium]|nr:secretin N-terminal domain-containing protein [Alphaproteobacteria bacterium]